MTPRTRVAIGSLALSAAGFVGIVLQEGYSDNAIIPTKGDVPTVGFGSTTGVKMGDTITPPRAVARAASELDTVYEAAVKRCVKAPLHQAEYDVYVDMTYNIGTAAFCQSSMVVRLNSGDYAGACNAILLWNKVGAQRCDAPGNRVCAGLWKRRLASNAKCMAAQ